VIAFAEEEAEGMEEVDFVADDLEDRQTGYCEDHAGDAPEEFAGDEGDDGEERAEVYLRPHDQWRDDIELGELDNAVGDDDEYDHVYPATLREGHDAGEGRAGDIADEGNDLEDAAENGEEQPITYADEREGDTIADPEEGDDDHHAVDIFLSHLDRTVEDMDDAGTVLFFYELQEEGADMGAHGEEHDHVDDDEDEVDQNGNDVADDGCGHLAGFGGCDQGLALGIAAGDAKAPL